MSPSQGLRPKPVRSPEQKRVPLIVAVGGTSVSTPPGRTSLAELANGARPNPDKELPPQEGPAAQYCWIHGQSDFSTILKAIRTPTTPADIGRPSIDLIEKAHAWTSPVPATSTQARRVSPSSQLPTISEAAHLTAPSSTGARGRQTASSAHSLHHRSCRRSPCFSPISTPFGASSSRPRPTSLVARRPRQLQKPRGRRRPPGQLPRMSLLKDPETAPDTVVQSSDDEDHRLEHGVHRRIRANSTIMSLKKILGGLNPSTAAL